jgi:hypothetical protein
VTAGNSCDYAIQRDANKLQGILYPNVDCLLKMVEDLIQITPNGVGVMNTAFMVENQRS